MPSLGRFLKKLRLANSHEAGDTASSIEPDTLPKQLEYKPLDETKAEIRLLKINPSKDERQPIHCTLRHVSCHKKWPKYTAVSYVWGDPEDTIGIYVNDCHVNVTVNLKEALVELRWRKFGALWIDALCINQGDKAERGHQVLRMKDIYSKASSAVVWLGSDEYREAEAAFRCMSVLETQEPKAEYGEIVEDAEKILDTEHKQSELVDAVRRMIALPYWSRTWIIQELVLSRNLGIFWGTHKMTSSTFKAGLERLAQRIPANTSFQGWGHIMGIMRVLNSFEANQKSSGTDDLSLLYALSDTSLSQATDPRDKIFSIVGLCSDGAALVPHPDYNQTLDTILRELMIKQLGHPIPDRRYRSMDLICLDDSKVPKRPGFPSWVVDWQTIWRSTNARTRSSTNSRGLNCEYRACGRSEHEVNVSQDGLVLNTCGYVFDKIRRLSPGISEQIPSSFSEDLDAEQSIDKNPSVTVAETYEAIWRTLVMDRDASSGTAKARAEWGFSFQNLYSNNAKPFFARLGSDIEKAAEIARNFLINGQTLYEWTQSGPDSTLEANAQHSAGDDRDARGRPRYESNSNETYLPEFIGRMSFGKCGKRLMTTKRGYLGLAHNQSRPGDLICLLRGCTVPMILRPCEGGHTVVGESYVHGIMDGEFWNVQDESTMQVFPLK